jgi:hypothetical protein
MQVARDVNGVYLNLGDDVVHFLIVTIEGDVVEGHLSILRETGSIPKRIWMLQGRSQYFRSS